MLRYGYTIADTDVLIAMAFIKKAPRCNMDILMFKKIMGIYGIIVDSDRVSSSTTIVLIDKSKHPNINVKQLLIRLL